MLHAEAILGFNINIYIYTYMIRYENAPEANEQWWYAS